MKNARLNQPFLSTPLFLSVLIWSCQLCFAQTNTTQVKVGVILDLNGSFGKMCEVSMKLSLKEFYASNPDYKTRINLIFRDSKKDVVGAAAAALDLMKNKEVMAIVGTENSWQAPFVINLGNTSQVPIVTASCTNPSLTSIRSPYFVRAAINDAYQVPAIVSIIKAFRWREVVPIYVDDIFGEGVIPYLIDGLQDIRTRVPYRCKIPLSASDDHIAEKLQSLMTNSTRVFVVHMMPELGKRVFKKAKEIGMMKKGYVWILTNGLTHLMKSKDIRDETMQGTLGVRTYMPKSKRREDYIARWEAEFKSRNPNLMDEELNIFGLWAYDAVVALAKAVKKAGTKDMIFDNNISRNATDLEIMGRSKYGSKLVEALSTIKFEGLAGDFVLRNNELVSSTIQVINLDGGNEKVVGFWTEGKGLRRELNSTNETTPSSKESLLPISWPGSSMSIPKGWEFPTNENKLRVVVPVKEGFKEFVNVTWDQIKNSWIVTGFCIEVFEEVLRVLPYKIIPEYIPFATPNRKPAGSYDELVRQVFIEKYDAAVGDISIVADRSDLVDFTLPYTESGVSMLVPLKDRGDKSTWAFLKPWSWDLWATTVCFFIFIGCVVWILEHRVNEDFRGPPHHQIGTTFWFSFSTMVFSNKERLVTNLGRCVVIIWFFVVFILIQSYTASLTSLLTVQQLMPTTTNVNDLISNGENVGYMSGSFVRGILYNLGFNDSKIKVYDSVETLDQLFKKGTAKGGIAAAFEEMPYIRRVLQKFCSKYTTMDPKFKTDGLGFALRSGSPLVSDLSKAILNVTQGKKMIQLKRDWFGEEIPQCTDPDTSTTLYRLSLSNFWGLFLIAGGACFVAIFLYLSMFLYMHRQTFDESSKSKQPLHMKLLTFLKIFNARDLSSHTYRRNIAEHHVSCVSSPFPRSPSTTQHSLWPPSPTISSSRDQVLPFSRQLNDTQTQASEQSFEVQGHGEGCE